MRFGIIGTGRISEWVLKGAFYDPRFTAVAICSRTEEKAHLFASQYGIPLTFTSVEDLASCPSIDAVYVGTPNSTHARMAITCMEHGKHVLVEKPFAANAQEAREMAECARRNGVVLMEAMISTLSNNFREVLNRMPSLGEIRGWSSTFCQYSKKFEILREGILATSFNPAFAGGATMDIGTYTIYPMVVLFGMPTEVDAHLLTLPVPETGEPIDYQGSVMFDYPGMSASVQYSKAIDSFLPTEIRGTQANLILDRIHICRKLKFAPYHEPTSGRMPLPKPQKITKPLEPDPYLSEFTEFMDVVYSGRRESEINSLDNSVAVMEILDEIRRQGGVSIER